MKHSISILLVIIVLLLSGCTLPFLRETGQGLGQPADPSPEFEIEQVVLSQGFQNTDSRIELSRKNNQLKLLVSPGIVKSAGMEVSEISQEDGVYNIHLVNSSYSSAELVIPQITILLTNVSQSQADSLKFNIVNENYTPVKVSHGIVDILNKIKSDFKISTDTSPSISLENEDDDLIWMIEYNNIYDTENVEIPVINLRLKVDGSTGQVVEYSKSLISSLVDHGSILDFVPGKGILYSKKDNDDSDSELWYYDLSNSDAILLYRTYSNISTAHLSPDGSQIGVLETEKDKKTAFVVSMNDKKAVRIGAEKDLVPEQIWWMSDNEIYILTSHTGNQSRFLSYNVEENSLDTSHITMMDISRFRVNQDFILVTEYVEEELNNRILISDGRDGFQFVDSGFAPEIINDDLGMYLKNQETNTANSLHIFDLRTLEDIHVIDLDVTAVNKVSPDEILVIERLQGNNSFAAHLLNITDMEIHALGDVNSSRVYYDMDGSRIFANTTISYRSDSSEIIYSIDVDKLKRR